MKKYAVMTSPNTGGWRQRGSEIIEFALLAAFMVPLFLYVFIDGMNLLRMIQCTAINRDIGSLYIHGVDYSTYQAQTVAATLAASYGLQVGSSFTGNDATNDTNSGNGYVVLSEVMYVGATSCSALPAHTSCTNQNQYVYVQRLDFGNKNVQFNGATVQSAIGNPSGATINSSGYVQNNLTDPNAVATNFAPFMTTTLADGQTAYVVETFFADPSLDLSALPAGGVYGRTFF